MEFRYFEKSHKTTSNDVPIGNQVSDRIQALGGHWFPLINIQPRTGFFVDQILLFLLYTRYAASMHNHGIV